MHTDGIQIKCDGWILVEDDLGDDIVIYRYDDVKNIK